MRRAPIPCLTALAVLMALPPTARAWPSVAYPAIFADAVQTLPPPLRELLEDMKPVLARPCTTMALDQAASLAISRFTEENGDLAGAVAALRDAGCAAAALNDPSLDALVETHRTRFTVVFYGWHPAIQALDLPAYLEFRRGEVDTLKARFARTSELPNRSEMVELSPEFGMASLAYSHAVTDVANVWLYVWMSVNGSF